MNSARHHGTKTAVSALVLALGLGASAIAAPAVGMRHGVVMGGIHRAASGTYTDLHNFTGTDGSAPTGNLDLGIGYGAYPTFYGVTTGGGSASAGTIFTYTPATQTFNSLYSFTGVLDGAYPSTGVATNDTNYFPATQTQLGTTITSGFADGSGNGTVYAVTPSGSVSVVHTFTGGADGAAPAGRITLFIDGNYYGTTTTGGTYGYGTIYKISPTGVFSTVYEFTGNNDGGAPTAGLAVNVSLSGVFNRNALTSRAASLSKAVQPYLYGTTSTAGKFGRGTIFRISPSGQFKTLYTFTGGNDGGTPKAKLVTDFHGNLFGTTSVGGVDQNGVVFRLDPDQHSTSYKVIHDFGNGSYGSDPEAQLTFGFNGKLYGTTSAGGASGQFGTIFSIDDDGHFKDIHDFKGLDGANPTGALLDGGDGYLYGAAAAGGLNSDGVLFSIAE